MLISFIISFCTEAILIIVAFSIVCFGHNAKANKIYEIFIDIPWKDEISKGANANMNILSAYDKVSDKWIEAYKKANILWPPSWKKVISQKWIVKEIDCAKKLQPVTISEAVYSICKEK